MNTQRINEISYLLRNNDKLRKILHDDIMMCINEVNRNLSSDNIYFFLRNLIRNFLSNVEGNIFLMKDRNILWCEFKSIDLPPLVYSFLNEKNYKIRKGKVIDDIMRISLIPNIILTFKITANIYKVEYQINTNDKRYNDFLEIISIRNKIVHPRLLIDMEIDVNKIKIFQNAVSWWNEQISNLYGEIQSKLNYK